MKKIFAVFAALIMVLSISACDSGKKEPEKTGEVTTTEDPNTIEVPDLSGLTRVQVEMKHKYLNFNFIEKYDDSFGEDEVITQSPEPGTRINKADEITVTISIGAKQVEVDDYTGRNIEDVKILIEKQGLKCETQLVESDSVPRNCVISTTPAARTRVDKGTSVTCFVSLGSPQQEIKVPPMVGMSIEDATKLAKENGIGLKVTYDDTSSLEPGTVISQGVDPDTVVQPNDKIEVTIAGENASASKSTTITVSVNKDNLKDSSGNKLVGEYDVKYYIDGTLEKTQIKEVSLTDEITWEISGTDVHVYSVMLVCHTTGKSGKLYEMEVDFTQNPPKKKLIDSGSDKIFSEIFSKD